MRRILFIGIAIGLMMPGIASVSQANSITAGDYVKLIDYNGVDGAGVMTYAVSHDKIQTVLNYKTFCIQKNVHVRLNRWYSVASLTDTVGLYDRPKPPGTGPLNGAVDYLFYRYKTGAYDLTMTTDDLEADLQKLFWSLQGSGPSFVSTGGYLWSTDLEDYNKDTSLQHSWGTKVINIYTMKDGHRVDIQNQLYNEPVPEPATMLLFGTGLIGIAAIRKRRNQN